MKNYHSLELHFSSIQLDIIIYDLYTLHQNNAHFPRVLTGSCICPVTACLFTVLLFWGGRWGQIAQHNTHSHTKLLTPTNIFS